MDRKRKKPKKKLENPQQNDGENFNKMFDEEVLKLIIIYTFNLINFNVSFTLIIFFKIKRAISSQKNMKLENSNGDQTVPTNQNFGYSSPGVPFQRSLSFHSNDNVSLNTHFILPYNFVILKFWTVVVCF